MFEKMKITGCSKNEDEWVAFVLKLAVATTKPPIIGTMELIACLMCALMIAQGMAHVTLALDFVNAMWTTLGSIVPPRSVEKNTITG